MSFEIGTRVRAIQPIAYFDHIRAWQEGTINRESVNGAWVKFDNHPNSGSGDGVYCYDDEIEEIPAFSVGDRVRVIVDRVKGYTYDADLGDEGDVTEVGDNTVTVTLDNGNRIIAYSTTALGWDIEVEKIGVSESVEVEEDDSETSYTVEFDLTDPVDAALVALIAAMRG